jgi:hypothetical protein
LKLVLRLRANEEMNQSQILIAGMSDADGFRYASKSGHGSGHTTRIRWIRAISKRHGSSLSNNTERDSTFVTFRILDSCTRHHEN